MVIGRMISRSLCWAIMKKMTKKWDLETSNVETEPKIRIYVKNWARQVLLKIFDLVNGQSQRSTVKDNGQRSCQRMTCADVRLGLTWQSVKQVWRVGARGPCWTGTCGAWVWGTVRGARAREAENSNGVCGRVWCVFWPFLVGFFSELSVLSLNAFAFTVRWAERLDPRVAGNVGVTAVTRFWQWWLDEGEGSGRTPEMSTGTRKSEEWLWYHVKNIKYEKDWIVCILMCM